MAYNQVKHKHDDSIVCDCMPELSAKDRATQAYSDTIAYYITSSGANSDVVVMLATNGKPSPLLKKVATGIVKLQEQMAKLDEKNEYPSEWQEAASWLELIGGV